MGIINGLTVVHLSALSRLIKVELKFEFLTFMKHNDTAAIAGYIFYVFLKGMIPPPIFMVTASKL